MIARIARRLRGSGSDSESGLGLVEIIVSSMISLVILGTVASMFISTAKITTNAYQNRNSTSNATNAMSELSEVIHLATANPVTGQTLPDPAVVSGTATKLVIISFVDVTSGTNPAPTQVTLDTSSGNLVETRCVGKSTNGFWTFAPCASTVTTTFQGTFVAPGTGQNALFTYLGSTGNTIAMTGSPASLSTLAARTSVASIVVSVNVQAPNSKTGAVYLTSNVGMPNVGLQQATP